MAMARNTSTDRFPSVPLNWGPTDKRTKAICIDCEHIVFPAHPSQRHHINLSALDLPLLRIHYNQRGLLYDMASHCFSSAVTLLEKSLSEVLASFYPLAGRLTTSSNGAICIDCNDAGVAFIEASGYNITIADLMAVDVPTAVEQLFAFNGAINVEGHRLPLLAVQVTKLGDGIFIACSLNHAIADGASLWHFFNSWAQLCRGEAQNLSINPVHDRCAIPSSPNRSSIRLSLDLDADIRKFFPPPLRIKMFQFSKAILQGLKDRANRDRKSLAPISSLQALCGHIWQAITRARRLDPEDPTTFQLPVNCRARLVPPLHSSYFGNAIQNVNVTTTAQEVASSDISFSAQLLHSIIQSHGDMAIKEKIDGWEKNPTLLMWENVGKTMKNPLFLGSSPRFKMYETDFGWGKPAAARSGCANKIDGKTNIYPGKEEGGSVDLELCLIPDTMNTLEIDQQFLSPLLVQDIAFAQVQPQV